MLDCKTGQYNTSEIIFHFPIICWGFEGQPACKHIKECLEEYKDVLTKRKYNSLLKKIKK